MPTTTGAPRLSTNMITALRFYAAVERGEDPGPMFGNVVNTTVALIDRDLVTTSQVVGPVHPLTDTGRRVLALLDACATYRSTGVVCLAHRP